MNNTRKTTGKKDFTQLHISGPRITVRGDTLVIPRHDAVSRNTHKTTDDRQSTGLHITRPSYANLRYKQLYIN